METIRPPDFGLIFTVWSTLLKLATSSASLLSGAASVSRGRLVRLLWRDQFLGDVALVRRSLAMPWILARLGSAYTTSMASTHSTAASGLTFKVAA